MQAFRDSSLAQVGSKVHANVLPVAQGPFHPAEIGFFEASAVNVTLDEYTFNQADELVLLEGGCQIQANGFRINSSYF